VSPLVALLESMQLTFLSYLGAHWVLFIVVVLLVVLLLAATWFLRNWKYAAAAILIAVVGLGYQAANMEGYKRKVSEDAQAQVVVLQKRLLAQSITAADDAKLASADAYLNSKLEALSRETPHNDSPCLDINSARRVRAIRASHGHVAITLSPGRSSGVLQKRSAAP
jgi:hypothetical protein